MESEPLPEDLAVALDAARRRLDGLASRVFYVAEAASTSDLAAELAGRGADDGTLVVADCQTAGRGRLGRTWVSPPGAGLYASVVLLEEEPLPGLLTLAAGVALAEGVAAATGLPVDLKWPNDLYVGNRKLAGILAERAAPYVVLGFGVNLRPAAYPSDVSMRATSLELELGRPVDRGPLLAECLAALASRRENLRLGRRRAIIDAWRARAGSTLGRRVAWDDGGAERRGVARDIDEDGALVVETPSGRQRVVAGDVRWI